MRNKTELMEQILKSPKAQEIIDYVSPVYGDSYVGLWIFEVIGRALDLMCSYVESFPNEVIPGTATWGLDLFENEYAIAKDDSLSYEERRAQVLEKVKSRGPYNPTRLASILSEMAGGADVTIEENTAQNKFDVVIFTSTGDRAAIEKKIEALKPAHLIYSLRMSTGVTAAADMCVVNAVTTRLRYTVNVE